MVLLTRKKCVKKCQMPTEEKNVLSDINTLMNGSLRSVSGLQETKVELVKREATKNAKGHLSHLVDAFKQKLNAPTVGKLAEMQCVDGILKIARRNHDPD